MPDKLLFKSDRKRFQWGIVLRSVLQKSKQGHYDVLSSGGRFLFSYDELERLTLDLSGVDVRPSTIKAAGRGLFATRRFDVGDLITEYGGIVISCEEAKKRREAGKASHIRTLDSMYTAIDGLSVTVATGNPGGSFANDPHRGDVKEKPNRWNATFVKLEHRQQIGLRLCERGGLQALARIFLKAVRVILPNDEIFVNYGRGYWDRTQTGDTEESASDE